MSGSLMRMSTYIRTALFRAICIALSLSSCAHAPQSREDNALRVVGRPDVMEMGPIFYATEVLLPHETQLRPC